MYPPDRGGKQQEHRCLSDDLFAQRLHGTAGTTVGVIAVSKQL
jgi:hypothetical protein